MVSNLVDKILRFIIPIIVGVVLGVLASQIFFAGYLSEWHEIIPLENISRLITHKYGHLWAEAISGNLYSCNNNQCQRENVAPPTTTDYFETVTHCDPNNSGWPMFFPLSNPPPSLIDCLEITQFVGHYAYALDKDGKLWYWTGLDSEAFQLGVLSLVLGPIIGIVISCVLLWRRYKKNQSHHERSEAISTTNS